MAQTFSKFHEREDKYYHQEQINNFISILILKSQYCEDNNNDINNDIEEDYRELIINTVYGISDTKECEYYISLLYRLILYTRDNINGLNHPRFSYMMLGVWIKLADESNDILFKNGYIFVKNFKVDSFFVHNSIKNLEIIKKEKFVQLPGKSW